MGNTPAPWMWDKLADLKSFEKSNLQTYSIPSAKPLSKLAVLVGKFLWVNLFYRFRRQFFGFLGMKEKY